MAYKVIYTYAIDRKVEKYWKIERRKRSHLPPPENHCQYVGVSYQSVYWILILVLSFFFFFFFQTVVTILCVQLYTLPFSICTSLCYQRPFVVVILKSYKYPVEWIESSPKCCFHCLGWGRGKGVVYMYELWVFFQTMLLILKCFFGIPIDAELKSIHHFVSRNIQEAVS